MSQSPTDATSLPAAREYLDNWNSLGEMISRGLSFSGRERHHCFLNTHGTRFADVSAAVGLDLIDDGRGLATMDWDHDGDLDVWFTSRTGPRVRLMRNDSPRDKHFLAIQLQGVASNRDAIGARVEVHVDVPDGAPRRIIQTLRAGEGFLSQSGKWLHFGLGSAGGVARLVVRWPGSNDVETFTQLAVDARYRIVQGSGRAVVVPQRPPAVPLAARPALQAKSSAASRTVLTDRVPLREFSYRDLDGQVHVLNPSGGPPLLINLWASWCQPCISELQGLARKADDLRKRGLSVVALSTDALTAPDGSSSESGVASARELWDRGQFPFDTGLAPRELIEELTSLDHRVFYRQLELPVPCSFLLDARGKLAVIYKGPVEAQQVSDDLDLLAAKPAEIELAASPFPGRQVIKGYDPTPLGLARAYLEAGYVDEAREQAQRHLREAASVKDFDRLAGTLLESLRPGVVHERRAVENSTSTSAANAVETPALEAAPSQLEDQLKRNLLAQQRQMLARGYELLAAIEYRAARFDDQVDALQQLVELRPADVAAKVDLALALGRVHRSDAAAAVWDEALREHAQRPGELVILGQGKMKAGQVDAATELFDKAVKRAPESVEARLNLAIAHQVRGRAGLAIEQYRAILKVDSESREALNNLAWIRATAPDPADRDDVESLHLARRLCEAAGYDNPAYLDTLAAALAASGDFAQALDVSQKAIRLARARAENDLAEQLVDRRKKYAAGTPHRE